MFTLPTCLPLLPSSAVLQDPVGFGAQPEVCVRGICYVDTEVKLPKSYCSPSWMVTFRYTRAENIKDPRQREGFLEERCVSVIHAW